MKYRKLTTKELEPLEKEFIDFLVVNGVQAADWEVIKAEQPDKANGIIDAFSDVIFEGILRKTQFIEFRDKHEILTFQCTSNVIYLAGLRYEGEDEFDFMDNDYIQSILQSPPKELKIFTQEKSYTKTREVEIFDLLQNGAQMSDGKLFKAITIAKLDNEGA